MPGIDIEIVGLAATLKKLEAVAKATSDLTELHRRIGIKVLQWVWRNFEQGGLEQKWTPLRPNTVYARRMLGGGSKPLQDTGGMRESFSFKPTATSVVIGSNNLRALWAHGGTKAHVITAKPGSALAFPSLWTQGKSKAFAKQSGTPMGAFSKRFSPEVVKALWISPKAAAKMGKGKFMKQATTFQATGRGKKDFATLNFMVVQSVNHPGTPPRRLLPSVGLANTIAKQVTSAYITEVMGGKVQDNG